MNPNRKSKPALQIHKNCHSSLGKKLPPKQSHLLSKPHPRLTSCSKQTNSFSTLNSQNVSRTSTWKLKLQHSASNQKHGKKQLQNLVATLENQLRFFKKLQSNANEFDWYLTVERVSKNISNDQVRSLLMAVQQGYGHCYERKKSCVPPKESRKIGLNIGDIKKERIVDYHDEFMSKIQEYSPSWRALIQAQEKRKL